MKQQKGNAAQIVFLVGGFKLPIILYMV